MPRKKITKKKADEDLEKCPAMSTRSRAITKKATLQNTKTKKLKSKDEILPIQKPMDSEKEGIQKKSMDITDTSWGTLQAVNPQFPNIALKGEKFTIGGDNCDWNIKELSGNDMLCTLKVFSDQQTISYSIVSHSSCQLKHNDKSLSIDEEEPLMEADSICLGSESPFYYVFKAQGQLVSSESPNCEAEHQQSCLQPPSGVVENEKTNTMLGLPKEMFCMDQLVLDGGSETPENTKKNPVLQETPNVQNEQPNQTNEETMGLTNEADSEPTNKDPLRKVVDFHKNSISPYCSNFPNSTSTKTKTGEETNKESGSTNVTLSCVMESMTQSILSAEDNPYSFSSFPYYLSEKVKERLFCTAKVYFQDKALSSYVYGIETINRRILLTGPSGSSRYMTSLVGSLAKDTGADLLTFDWEMIQGDNEEDNEEDGATGTGDEILDSVDFLEEYERRVVTTGDSTNFKFGPPRKTVRRGRTSPSTRAEPERVFQLKKSGPGGSTSVMTPSTSVSFRKGDRVIFMGSSLKRKSNTNATAGTGGMGKSVDYDKSESGGPWFGCAGKVVLPYLDTLQKVGVCFDSEIPGGCHLGETYPAGCGYFCDPSDLKLEGTGKKSCQENQIISSFFDVAQKAASKKSIIIHLKDAEMSVLGKTERFLCFKRRLELLNGPILVIGTTIREQNKDNQTTGLFSKFHSHPSAMLEFGFFEKFGRNDTKNTNKAETAKSMKLLGKLFPNSLPIMPPTSDLELTEWKRSLERDTEVLNEETNRRLMSSILAKCNVLCPELDQVAIKEAQLGIEEIERLIGLAIAHRLSLEQEIKFSEEDGKLFVEKIDIQKASELFKGFQEEPNGTKNVLQDVVTDNEYEKRLLSEVVPPEEVGVGFHDIGALENVKKTLHEIVMLPLQRPELFARGQLLKPAKGVLLFGPPGTGKTMLAKALAAESGANFMNMSVSSIASKWFGEGEKYVRALFSLAHKIAPCVIFVDEVDSMLGRRDKTNEHEAMRKIKNEFMLNWDGLRTNEHDRVLVLAATNRPMDLDEAVIRRMPRRLLVDLPDTENRIKILKTILRHEHVSQDFRYEEIAALTEGYSGSDLKNLCLEAAFHPVRDYLKQEKSNASSNPTDSELSSGPKDDSTITKTDVSEKLVLSLNPKKSNAGGSASSSKEHPCKKAKTVELRPIQMKDMLTAARQIASSVSTDAISMNEIRNWNQMYGEGGNRQKTTLSYFM